MKTIGFTKSQKRNERRRAFLPEDLAQIRNPGQLIFEKGYAAHMGIDDEAYLEQGARIASRAEVMQADIICCPKAPEPQERAEFKTGQTFFGWAHAVQGRSFVDFALDKQLTVIAWEDMFEGGRHSFWRNNELAGEAAVLHALPYLGTSPHGLTAAVIGFGNCGRGAFTTLTRLGVSCEVFTRKDVGQLRDRLPAFNIIVNAVMWDVSRTDHLIYEEDLERIRRPSLIIDISCDEHMGIATSRATPLDNPVYEIDGVVHYVVDHTPTLLFRTASAEISSVLARFVDDLIEGRPNPCLEAATCIESGRIKDPRILDFQKRDAAGAVSGLTATAAVLS